jgi:large subunit ribosomal protein L29
MSTKVKIQDLRELSIDALNDKLVALKKELFEARFKQATNQLDSTAVFGHIKHQVSQISTVIREKELAL